MLCGVRSMRLSMHSIRTIISFYVSLICFKLERNFKLHSFFFAIFDLDPRAKVQIGLPPVSRSSELPLILSLENDGLQHSSERKRLQPRQNAGLHGGTSLLSSEPFSSILEEDPFPGPRDELWEMSSSDAKDGEEDMDLAAEEPTIDKLIPDEYNLNRDSIVMQCYESPRMTDRALAPDQADFSFPSPVTPVYEEEFDYNIAEISSTTLKQKVRKIVNYNNPSVVRQLSFSPDTSTCPNLAHDHLMTVSSDDEDDSRSDCLLFGRDSDDDIVPSVGSWEVGDGSDGTFSERSERIISYKTSRRRHRWSWKPWFFASKSNSAKISPTRVLSTCSERFLSCSGRMQDVVKAHQYQQRSKIVGNLSFKHHKSKPQSPRRSFDGDTRFSSSRWLHKECIGQSFNRHFWQRDFCSSAEGTMERPVENDPIWRLVKERQQASSLTVADLLQMQQDFS